MNVHPSTELVDTYHQRLDNQRLTATHLGRGSGRFVRQFRGLASELYRAPEEADPAYQVRLLTVRTRAQELSDQFTEAFPNGDHVHARQLFAQATHELSTLTHTLFERVYDHPEVPTVRQSVSPGYDLVARADGYKARDGVLGSTDHLASPACGARPYARG